MKLILFIFLHISQITAFTHKTINAYSNGYYHDSKSNELGNHIIQTCKPRTSFEIHLSSSLTQLVQQKRVGKPPKMEPPSIFKNTIVIFLVGWCLKIFTKRWILVKAGEKFFRAGGWTGIYFSIPILSGIINMATNKLAVFMIFSPLTFKGKEFLSRKEGQPGTLIGWQGIVPSKVKKMAGDIADTVLTDLLDLNEVFARIDSAKLASLLTPKLSSVIDIIIKKRIFGDGNKDLLQFTSLYEKVIENKTQTIVKRLIDKIKKNPNRYIDVKQMVVDDLVADKQLICDLFQKCGREELKFIVSTGLWGGMFLGLAQMAGWLLYPLWWSLPLGGALVGYLTDWFALKIMFEPVNPVMIGIIMMIIFVSILINDD
jgi:uncharacterized membrane protein YheB (UPF0754 family)